MNYFLTFDGLVPTGMSAEALFDYLYRIKNPTQRFDEDEMRRFKEIIDHPYIAFTQHNSTATYTKYGLVSKQLINRSVEDIRSILERSLHKNFALILGEVENEGFDFRFQMYGMDKSKWDVVVRTRLIDEFLVENV